MVRAQLHGGELCVLMGALFPMASSDGPIERDRMRKGKAIDQPTPERDQARSDQVFAR